MAGNVGVKELGDCRPTPVDPVTKSSEGVFGLFFKFGVGLEGRQRIFDYELFDKIFTIFLKLTP